MRAVRDRQRHTQQLAHAHTALSACVDVLQLRPVRAAASAASSSVDSVVFGSKAALVERLRLLAGAFTTDVMEDGGVESVVVGGKTFMLEVTLCSDAALAFAGAASMQYISTDGQSMHSYDGEQRVFLDCLRRGDFDALARWFGHLRRAEEWTTAFKADVRLLLAVAEDDIAKLVASRGDALLGRLHACGPTGFGLAYYAPLRLDGDDAVATRTLHLAIEHLPEAQAVSLPLQSQLVSNGGGDAQFADELVGPVVANSHLRYVACLSHAVPLTLDALQALLADAGVAERTKAPPGSADAGLGALSTPLQLLYTQCTGQPAPASPLLEAVTSGRRQRLSVNFGSGAPAVLVQRVPFDSVRKLAAVVGALRQQHLVHEILASLLLAAQPADGSAAAADDADVYEVSHLPPDRIVVHLSVGAGADVELAALVVRVDAGQQIACELSGVVGVDAQSIADYAARLLIAARSLPHALARIAPLLRNARGGGSGAALSDVARARLQELGVLGDAPPSQRAKRSLQTDDTERGKRTRS